MKLLACLLLSAFALAAQTLSGEALVKALQQGGYVIVMRHAASPRTVPDRAAANPDNLTPERQLDQEGRASATSMGRAVRELKIPIGEVYTSPTYRAVETVKYAELGTPKKVEELGDNGRSMAGGTSGQAAWLQKLVNEPRKGTNVIAVTHSPNLTGAFPKEATGVADGEALIFGANSQMVARVKIDEWETLKK
jgi:phosphohistidine phosphatase SixA